MSEGVTAAHGGLVSEFVGVVPPDLLASINASIEAARHEWQPPDGRRASAAARQFADALRRHEAFSAMEAQVCAAARQWVARTQAREANDPPIHVLRCVGPAMAAQSYLRHFDSHVLTVLIPLQRAPDGEQNGDLIVHMRRCAPLAPLAHLMTKAWLFFEHGLPFGLRRAIVNSGFGTRRGLRIRCEPGNAYVFNGFVTLHHNLHVADGERRSLIIHHYDAGLEARLRTMVRAVRHMRDRLAGYS
ncbi:hypothetical protein G3N59_32175 [Paraburkholderia sp. Ac-20340]|uniref:hypothetical protein n=1 Tax=Paraburkholderia sp. Ac-20340 TaxID=2703888 RepID=UPI001981EAD1|nr:hypothetical protein [Paraburkholderia sp. Ac-20340]MBN3858054.1 hypothetical protein [Paraburkholderia sp. Ac-20340]